MAWLSHSGGASAAVGAAALCEQRAGEPGGGSQLEPPSPEQTLRAFGIVRGWLDQWAVPEPVPEGLGLPACEAAAVELRLGGRVLGRGEWVVSEPGAGPSDRAVWEAAQRAVAQAGERVPRGADNEALAGLGRRLTLSLELGGGLVPIAPRTRGDVDAAVAPGLEGLAVRASGAVAGAGGTGGAGGERGGATLAQFPARMLAENATPAEVYGTLVSVATGSAALALSEPGELSARHGVRAFRFRVSHAAQGEPGGPGRFVYRGGRVIPPTEVDSVAELRQMADAMARFLIGRAGVPGGAGLGAYRPWDGGADPPSAGGSEAALAALALGRYAQSVAGAGGRAQSRAAVAELLGGLASVGAGERAPWDDPATAALVVLVPAGALPVGDEPVADLVERCRRRVIESAGAGEAPAGVPEPLRGLLAAAVLSVAAGAPEGQRRALRDSAQGLVRATLSGTPPAALVTQMPWLGWAELAASGPGQEPPSAAGLRRMRSLVHEHTLTARDAGPDGDDLVGGVVFTASRAALPSWQFTRPLTFVATMLGDARLTPAQERPAELVRLLGLMRFLRQLQADAAHAWMHADPAGAHGGVRVSLWDQRMPIEATAMSLLATAEALQSIAAISSARADADAPDGDQP
ncbi:MAG: hypothetical protein C0513_02785 [Isosphaera sp.]|nr:hypothetical protein [Isosphaera sp.]